MTEPIFDPVEPDAKIPTTSDPVELTQLESITTDDAILQKHARMQREADLAELEADIAQADPTPAAQAAGSAVGEQVGEEITGTGIPSAPGQDIGAEPPVQGPKPLPFVAERETDGIFRTFIRNVSPVEAAGGFADAFGNVLKTADDLNTAMLGITQSALGMTDKELEESVFLGPGIGNEVVKGAIAEFEELSAMFGEGREKGSLIRSLTEFFVPFSKVGKLQQISKLATSGKPGRFAADVIKGAVADFTIDPEDAKIVDFIEGTILENPIFDQFKSVPGESPIVGRLKRAGEGGLVGGTLDVLFSALGAGVRAFRARQGAAEGVGVVRDAESVFAEADEAVKIQKRNFTEALGDPDGALTSARETPEQTAARTARAIPIEEGFDPAQEEFGDVFINWARIDSPNDVKDIMQDLLNARAMSVDEARRGVVSFEETQLAADSLDAWEVVMERRASGGGSPLNDAQITAVRQLHARSGAKVKQLQKIVLSGNARASDEIAFRKMLAVHNTIQEQVVAARTETARALNAMKIPAGDTLAFSGEFEKLMRQVETGREGTIELAKRLQQMEDMGEARAVELVIHGSRWAKTKAMVTQLYYSGMLSSPLSHARNILGNSGMLNLQVIERKGANILGKATGNVNVPDGETTALMFGMVNGVRDAFRIMAIAERANAAGRSALAARAEGAGLRDVARNAGREFMEEGVPHESLGPAVKSLLTGQSGFGLSKLEQPRVGAFSSEALGLDRETWFGRIANTIDAVTMSTSRGLMVEDEVFKTINLRGEINTLAVRKATEEVNAGTLLKEDYLGRVTQLLNTPDDVMTMAARTTAEVATFTSKPMDSKLYQAFQKFSQAGVIGRLFLPFANTPWNIGVESFARGPLAPVTKKFREEIKAGGATADIAWSKFILGNAVLLTSVDLASQGWITGDGPAKHAERETLRRTGWQPRSIKVPIPGKPGKYRYLSYRGLDPVTATMGIAANTYEILLSQDWNEDNKDLADVLMASALAVGSQLTSQNYMSGISGLFDAMSSPTRYQESFYEGLVRPVVPAFVAHLNRAMFDNNLHEVNGMLDALRARTPGLSDDLPLKRDLWGREIIMGSDMGPLYDAVSPLYASTIDAEPIDTELIRLERWLSKPQHKQNFGGIQVNLERYPEAYDMLVRLTGQEMKVDLEGNDLFTSDGYESEGRGLMDELNALVTGRHGSSYLYDEATDGVDGGKSLFINSIVSVYKAQAKRIVFDAFPEIQSEVTQKQADKAAQRGEEFFPEF